MGRPVRPSRHPRQAAVLGVVAEPACADEVAIDDKRARSSRIAGHGRNRPGLWRHRPTVDGEHVLDHGRVQHAAEADGVAIHGARGRHCRSQGSWRSQSMRNGDVCEAGAAALIGVRNNPDGRSWRADAHPALRAGLRQGRVPGYDQDVENGGPSLPHSSSTGRPSTAPGSRTRPWCGRSRRSRRRSTAWRSPHPRCPSRSKSHAP